MNDIVAELMQRLPSDLLEAYEERAGIIEFDAGKPRGQAECLAMLDLLRTHPDALLGVTCLRVELNGSLRFVLTTDIEALTKRCRVVRAADLSEVIRAQFGGSALLTALK
jgi:hypothetical protein